MQQGVVRGRAGRSEQECCLASNRSGAQFAHNPQPPTDHVLQVLHALYQVLLQVQGAHVSLRAQALNPVQAIALQPQHTQGSVGLQVLNAAKALVVQVQLVIQRGGIVQALLLAQVLQEGWRDLHLSYLSLLGLSCVWRKILFII